MNNLDTMFSLAHIATALLVIAFALLIIANKKVFTKKR